MLHGTRLKPVAVTLSSSTYTHGPYITEHDYCHWQREKRSGEQCVGIPQTAEITLFIYLFIYLCEHLLSASSRDEPKALHGDKFKNVLSIKSLVCVSVL